MDTPTGGADLGKTSSGLQPNLAALLAYSLGLITGLIFFLTEKENRFVRFHALQSMLLSIALFVLCTVLMVIPILGWMIIVLLQLVGFVLWIVMMVSSYQGKWIRLPVLGNVAAKQLGL